MEFKGYMSKALVLDSLLSVSYILPFLSCALLMYDLALDSAYIQTQLLLSSLFLILHLLIVESLLTDDLSGRNDEGGGSRIAFNLVHRTPKN